jgi:hypothetical protein
VAAFLLRLTKNTKQIWVHSIGIAACAAVGLASLLLVTIAMPFGSGYYWAFYQNTANCKIEVLRLRKPSRNHVN